MFFMQEWLIYNHMILSECPQYILRATKNCSPKTSTQLAILSIVRLSTSGLVGIPTGLSKSARLTIAITLVYYGTGETSCVAMPGKNLIPFSEQSITDLKLDQIKNKKLKNAIAAARASI